MRNPYAVLILHQWWRLITASFLHGGLLHIGFNMMVLLGIGLSSKKLYGSPRYLFLYIVTGAAGFTLSVFHHPAVGASASLLGLIGSPDCRDDETQWRSDAGHALTVDLLGCFHLRDWIFWWRDD